MGFRVEGVGLRFKNSVLGFRMHGVLWVSEGSDAGVMQLDHNLSSL